jgi:hypothetical protein
LCFSKEDELIKLEKQEDKQDKEEEKIDTSKVTKNLYEETKHFQGEKTG